MKNKTSTRLPNWASVLLAIIVGLGVYFITTRMQPKPEPEVIIQEKITHVQDKRDSITGVIKNSSHAAAKKSDSLVNLLKHEPWKLSQQDMKDSTVVNFLKNYRYE